MVSSGWKFQLNNLVIKGLSPFLSRTFTSIAYKVHTHLPCTCTGVLYVYNLGKLLSISRKVYTYMYPFQLALLNFVESFIKQIYNRIYVYIKIIIK